MTTAHKLLPLGLLLAGCVSVAPPVRTGQYGAPGRMDAGMVEAGAGASYGLEVAGGPNLGYGVTESVTVEGGAEVGTSERVMGWAGARYSPLRPEGRRLAFVLDVEGGAGAGVGGRRCEDSVCESSAQNFRRPAGGGYVGLGIGGKIAWFWPWLRVRTQLSAAEGVPVTSLTTAMAGVQFSITELAHIYVSTGGYYLHNQNIGIGGWFAVDGGLSFTIATPRTKRLRAQRQRLGAR